MDGEPPNNSFLHRRNETIPCETYITVELIACPEVEGGEGVNLDTVYKLRSLQLDSWCMHVRFCKFGHKEVLIHAFFTLISSDALISDTYRDVRGLFFTYLQWWINLRA